MVSAFLGFIQGLIEFQLDLYVCVCVFRVKGLGFGVFGLMNPKPQTRNPLTI